MRFIVLILRFLNHFVVTRNAWMCNFDFEVGVVDLRFLECSVDSKSGIRKISN